MSTNLEYRAGERQRKRESRRRASEAQREKGRQRSRVRDKKQRRHFFVGRITWKFCSGGDKMGNASGHQWKVKISGSEKKWTRARTKFPRSIKRVTKKFLEVSPGVCKTRTGYLRMADADWKVRIEKCGWKKMRITKKVRRKKREMWLAKNINKQKTKGRNLSFKSLSHGWTLHLHRERDANSWHSYFVPCNSFH